MKTASLLENAIDGGKGSVKVFSVVFCKSPGKLFFSEWLKKSALKERPIY
jgi:hypothetical protein